jgi:hypothetical protein
MIHIVFQFNDQEVLREAIAKDPHLEGEIIQIGDDFAVGPIVDLYDVEGREARSGWWRQVFSGGDYEHILDDGSVPDDHGSVLWIRKKLQAGAAETTWIWAAPNQHDVSGYFWLIGQLKEFQGRVFIVYPNNLPFISDKGSIFYPSHLFEIPVRELLKAKKLARPITASEFETDPDEWMRLSREQGGVRILEGGKKLISHGYDYYDADLTRFITGDWTRANRIIHHFLAKAPQVTGDAFLLWRLKQIIAGGGCEVQGETRGMKDFEIRRKGAEQVEGGTEI